MSLKSVAEEFPEVERYELHAGPGYRFEANRREFVQVLGAGLLIAVSSRAGRAQPGGRRRGSGGRRSSEKLSERFHIDGDGVVTVLTSKVEVGQGSRTQLAQAAAEELRLPVDRLRLIMADTEICPDDGGTAGSRTTPSTVPQVRSAAAAARELLIGMAAERLHVERSFIRFEKGVFSVSESDESLTLGELAGAREFVSEFDVPMPEGVSVAAVEEWTVLGRSIDKVAGEDVVTGRHAYPSDIVREGMLYGKVLRPESYGASLEAIDVAPARAMEGVMVVREGDFVGCAAKDSWTAAKAVDALRPTARWSPPNHVSSAEVFEHFKRTANERAREETWGDRKMAFAGAKHQLKDAYTVAYIQHAPMEPRAAVAEWQDGKLTVWTGTQQPSRVQGELAEAFRIPEERVRVIVPDTGGGFGGKHSGEAAVEAARLAKAARRPVSLRWTREEEFTWAYARPAGLIEIEAAIDNEGRLSVWDFSNYNSGGSAIESPYRAPHGRTRFISCDSPLRQGSYRALASTANTFARESAIDDLAQAAASDPLQFRLRHLAEGRLKDVLRTAAEKFGWTKRRVEGGKDHRGVGLACGTEKGSYVAACAEVEVRDGEIKVLGLCQAYECGAIQNPQNLKMQVEGCIIMGLGGALWEALQFQDGRITNANFSQYRVPRMRDLPRLDIHLVDRRDLPSVGAGETPIIAVAPAIRNAVLHASGRRLRSMPMTLGGA
jgi:isoquinoline 1-oxidoreductase